MAPVQILPEILSNKIAAGEVVERPASVVKELVENAIDAAADRIRIDIEQGGRTLIQVSDNGAGMAHDDALLAIERYATSKIAAESDLFDIRTLGFRGEALPSIAAVSRFTLTTRTHCSDAATEIVVDGGRIKSVNPTGAPAGTMVSVRQLFFNTPARRKFLKTVTTEMGHVADTIACIALAHPGIAFRLTHNGKTVKDWPRAADPMDRITHVLGDDLHRLLYGIAAENEAAAVSGWISDPSVTRSNTGKIYVFVNGRYIRDRGVQYAIVDGYRGRLMKDRFPLAVLFIELPAGEVDINVHPTKHEVRFFQQKQVYSAIRAAVAGAWQTAPTAPADPERHRENALPAFDRPPAVSNRPHQGRTNSGPPSSNINESQAAFERPAPTDDKNDDAASPPPRGRPAPQTDPPPAPEQPALFEGTDFFTAEVIGQFRNTYILCARGEELLLVDQHAAHERILYERFAHSRQSENAISVQQLLMPETIEVQYREAAAIEQMTEDLNRLGLEIEHFGGNTFVVKAVPEVLADREIKPLITDIAETAVSVGYTPGLSEAIDQCRILMACHGAIRANQGLTTAEMKALMAQLDQCENPHQCPHGRPTVIRWPVKDLEKRFKRTL